MPYLLEVHGTDGMLCADNVRRRPLLPMDTIKETSHLTARDINIRTLVPDARLLSALLERGAAGLRLCVRLGLQQPEATGTEETDLEKSCL